MSGIYFTRRQFVATSVVGAGSLLLPAQLIAAELPTDNPTAKHKLAWTDEIKWGNVVDITRMEGGGK
ncbi:MAG: hypothetical protein NXI22_06720 [bacterium]|nr:hypothetical protein [bacterium]